MNAIERQIVEIFTEAGATACADERLDYRLIEDAALDSFSRISICMELESHFDVRLTSDELLDERYRSVAGLARLLGEKSGAATASGDGTPS